MNTVKTVGPLCAVLIALSVGCASRVWYRPAGMSMDEGKREMYACERDAAMLPRSPGASTTTRLNTGSYYTEYSPNWLDELERETMFNRCMESKGFVKGRR